MAIRSMGVPEILVVHHSASPRDTTTLELIREWHTDPRKKGGPFRDVGYHFVIEASGAIRPGRPLPRIGAHAPPNAKRIGFCIAGDNTVAGENWNGAQIVSAIRLIGAVRLLWPSIDVEGHRDVMAPGYTECPGLDVAEVLLV